MTDAAKNLLRHPDENLLAALAENTLMPQERQEILDHLAMCRHCRDAVFLAQEATTAAAAYQSPELKTSAGSGFRARLSAWKPVWALAVIALASVITIPWLLTDKRQHPPSPAIQLAAKQPEPQVPAVSANAPAERPQTFASAGRTEPGKPLQKSAREKAPQTHSTQSQVLAKKAGPERVYNKQRVFSKAQLGARGSLSAQFEQRPGGSAGAMGAGSAVNGLVSPPMSIGGPAIRTGASDTTSAANAVKSEPKPIGALGGTMAASPAPPPSLQYFPQNPADRKIAAPLQANFRITNGVVERCHGTDCAERPLPARRTCHFGCIIRSNGYGAGFGR